MAKLSAGIIAYRKNLNEEIEILLIHPGGPFFKNKDVGVWSIPKGEYEQGEDPLVAAKREFEEETGNVLPEHKFLPLTAVKIKSGKTISVWAAEADFDEAFIRSNFFEMEWPPKSGKKQSFAEVDKAGWFSLENAKIKISAGQLPFVNELQTILPR